MCWRNFCNFPWWLKNVKSRSKIALFSNERHFEIWFPKKRITFFWSKLSITYTKKTQFCMWQTTFSLKQGETRTSHGPIPHPLTNTRFRVLYLEWTIVKRIWCSSCSELTTTLWSSKRKTQSVALIVGHRELSQFYIWCYIKKKSFQNIQWGHWVIIILPIKSKMTALTYVSPQGNQVNILS